jgi:hypothetical protein
MSVSKRLKLGFLLLVLSVVGLIALYLAILYQASLPGHLHVIGSGTDGLSGWIDAKCDSDVSLAYLVPIVLSGMTGAILLVWPARKPPKLDKI